MTPGSSCIANAYSNNHDTIVAKDTGTLRAAMLHGVDALALVHALILRLQALLLPFKTLVFSVALTWPRAERSADRRSPSRSNWATGAQPKLNCRNLLSKNLRRRPFGVDAASPWIRFVEVCQRQGEAPRKILRMP